MQPVTVPSLAPSISAAAAPTIRRHPYPVALLMLLRPYQWVKNLLVVPLPLVDAEFWTEAGLIRLGVMIGAFILASSLVYVVNDLADRDRDRRHPVKRLRPIASGQVSVPVAWLLTAALATGLVVIVVSLPPSLSWPLLVYVPLNLAYSFWLKHVALIDSFVVAAGFVLRVLQGYLALGEPPSRWLVLAVFSACLLLTLARRRHELINVDGARHRPALAGYTITFIDQAATLCAVLTAATMMWYLATEAPIQPYRSLAVVALGPLAVFALFRYLQLVSVGGQGGNAVGTLLRDPVMVSSGGIWSGTLLILVLAT